MRALRSLAAVLGVLTCLTSPPAAADQSRPALEGARSLVWPKKVGQTTRLGGGAEITLSAGALVERLPDRLVKSGAQNKTRTYVYKLSRGQLEVNIGETGRNTTAVLVMAPQGLSGAVLGGRGVVRVSRDSISFTAREHAMLIAKGSHSRQLAEGQTLAVDDRGGFHQVGQPPQPELFIEQGLALTMPGAGFKTTVRFKPSDEVDSYQVALLKRKGNGWSRVLSQMTQRNHATLQGKEAGDYAVVARALNRFGVESEVSAAVPLRAVGVRLPRGARATDGGIFLAPTEHLELIAIDGLKMNYGLGAYSIDAPKSLSLGRSKRALVSLWDPTTESKLYLQLFAQATQARIKLGTPTATWPKDTIEAVVKLEDGAGRALENTKGFHAKVSVNLKPVALAWKRAKNVMRARIPAPPAMPGPWVIRLEVANAKGEIVGRDFLEVAKSPGR